VALLVGSLLVLASTACGGDANSITAQAKDGSRKGYISGDGAIESIDATSRAKPVALAGTTLDGKEWSAARARGKVVVLNVWASWCPPCQAEAPALAKTAAAYEKSGQPVEFMGIDTRDNPASGKATAARWGIPFPSLNDESGVLILALQGKVSSPPTTLVLDHSGRIAARVNGEVSAATLTGLVDDVLAEKS
jgi:thiol-disulfide isomerase/thioredoxin